MYVPYAVQVKIMLHARDPSQSDAIPSSSTKLMIMVLGTAIMEWSLTVCMPGTVQALPDSLLTRAL